MVEHGRVDIREGSILKEEALPTNISLEYLVMRDIYSYVNLIIENIINLKM